MGFDAQTLRPQKARSLVETPKIVLDTNVCLDLIVFDDPRCALLREAILSARVAVVTRADCREEWMRVLSYPVLALDASARLHCIEQFDQWSQLLDVSCQVDFVLPRCRDPDDQKFLELARDAQVDALVTRDAELLRLAPRMKRAGGFAIIEPSRMDDQLALLCDVASNARSM
jgi:putative PIN family toxin of toxin-antitoxin system